MIYTVNLTTKSQFKAATSVGPAFNKIKFFNIIYPMRAVKKHHLQDFHYECLDKLIERRHDFLTEL